MAAGGKLASGNQWMSCISLTDVVNALVFAIHTESLQGPVNFVAPSPCTNAEFTATLGSVLRRPALFTQPEPVRVVALQCRVRRATMIISS